MRQTHLTTGGVALAVVLLLSGCSSVRDAAQGPATTIPGHDQVGPEVVDPLSDDPPSDEPATLDGDRLAFVDLGDDVEPLELIEPGAQQQPDWDVFVEAKAAPMVEVTPPIVGGLDEVYQAWELPDGRYLVVGSWHTDPELQGSMGKNPDGFPDAPPPTETLSRPIRLLLVDQTAGTATALSHIPEVRPFQTAVSIGEAADLVLQVAVLDDGRVAYVTGFSGSAYDVPYGAFVAEIPAI